MPRQLGVNSLEVGLRLARALGRLGGAQALKDANAERVLACAVHGVLSGPALDRIERSALEHLIVTNTIPVSEKRLKCGKIVELSVARLLGQAIRSIHEETSVSSLFV